MGRTPKKSETIEIRLSHELKTEFMHRCRSQERSASEVVRTLIENQLSPPRAEHRPVPHWRVAVAAVVGATLGLGAAAPSLARSGQNTHAAFDRLDRDHDGVLSYDEFRSR